MQVFTYIRMSPTAFPELLLLKNNHEDSTEHQNNTQLAVQLPNSSLIKSSFTASVTQWLSVSSLETCTLQAQKMGIKASSDLSLVKALPVTRTPAKQSNRDVHRRNGSESSRGRMCPESTNWCYSLPLPHWQLDTALEREQDGEAAHFPKCVIALFNLLMDKPGVQLFS